MTQIRTKARTVSYWKFVNLASGNEFENENWENHLSVLHGHPLTFQVGGQPVTGKVQTVTLTEDQAVQVRRGHQLGGFPTDNASVTYGVSIWTERDMLPNQAHRQSGQQESMTTRSHEWAPVDNLFLWFLPFSNAFAVIRENNSAPREGVFSTWLTQALREAGLMEGREMNFGVAPVVDETRRRRLERAVGARSITLASIAGENVGDIGFFHTVFGGVPHRFGALNIELNIKRTKDSADTDTAGLLEWFEETLGSLDSSATKAKATVEIPGERPQEVDLLKHRLTRKTTISFDASKNKSFTAEQAIDCMVTAYVHDIDDLLAALNV